MSGFQSTDVCCKWRLEGLLGRRDSDGWIEDGFSRTGVDGGVEKVSVSGDKMDCMAEANGGGEQEMLGGLWSSFEVFKNRVYKAKSCKFPGRRWCRNMSRAAGR